MKSIFLIEGSPNFAEQIFAVAQYFVSSMDLIFAIFGKICSAKICALEVADIMTGAG